MIAFLCGTDKIHAVLYQNRCSPVLEFFLLFSGNRSVEGPPSRWADDLRQVGNTGRIKSIVVLFVRSLLSIGPRLQADDDMQSNVKITNHMS